MNPRQLEAFRAVMTTGTTTRASDLMHTSQSAISRLVSQLEATLRLKLFDRDGARLRPTPEAKALLIEVDRMFAGMDVIRERATSLREGRSGILTIASLPALGYGPLPALITQLRCDMPDLLVRYEIYSSQEVRERVSSGQCDVGFAAELIDTHGLVARSIARRRAVLAVPADHVLGQQSRVSLFDLVDYPFIALSSRDTSRRQLDALLANRGEKLNVVIEVAYALTVASMVCHGAGIGVVDPLSVEMFDWHGVKFVEVDEPIWFNTLAIHNMSTPLSAPASKLLALADAAWNGGGHER
ncbi:LysR family transcriptional regulator [Burkholderia contaminans]|nr:LysR family transcriptional regulator [Burkholderia contaminans]